MAIRAPIVFLSGENEGCFSDHEVLNEEQEEKAFCLRRASLCQA
jgi:hypothetical protein